MAIEIIKAFFGWCSIINIGLLLFSTIMIVTIRGLASRIHAKLFNLDEQYLNQAYFQYLGQYKIATIVFNIVPYIALCIIS